MPLRPQPKIISVKTAAMEAIVRAVDVGRGNTKFITGIKNAELCCEMFPSQAYPTDVGQRIRRLGHYRLMLRF
ncbi:hypothetical protein ACZ75_06615 [Massilia sp. NR 4-1]|nr:hypothetical protein ACZ75_06615 [Massilia sp. NR 4-1]